MTVLVTGGAGFIGSALVRALVRDGADVVNLDKLTYAGSVENLGDAAESPRHRLVQADIADAAAVRKVFARAHPETIYHLAAETHVDRSIDAPAAFIQTNIVGTLTLLDAALDYWRTLPIERRERFRFVAISTDEVFGDLLDAPPADEMQPYRPSSPYAASKAAADHLCRAWQRTYGLPVIVSNCSNNYGPHQFPEKLIPTVILAALEGRPIPVYARGENVRDWLHVDDHAAALRRIAETGRPGETYLIGARCERRNLEIIELLCAHLDELNPAGRPHRRLITYVDDRPGHDLRYAIDPSKLERELSWRPRVPLDDGLRDTVGWYLSQRSWCERALARGGRNRRGLGRTQP
jgi:dTDP-glucose 4,6-dehydratase